MSNQVLKILFDFYISPKMGIQFQNDPRTKCPILVPLDIHFLRHSCGIIIIDLVLDVWDRIIRVLSVEVCFLAGITRNDRISGISQYEYLIYIT